MAAEPNDPFEELDPLGRYLSKLSTYRILFLLTVAAFTMALISLLLRLATNPADTIDWLEGFLQNFSTELFGALVTFIIIQQIVGGREQRQQTARQIEDEKQRLIRQLGSSQNNDAIRAAEELRARGWLYDGSLQGAFMIRANLQDAVLIRANLQDASLWEANLRDASLSGVNLKGADLSRANLQAADLENAHFNESTVLPDGSKWTPDTDLTRFTDPDHPDFWRSDNPHSFAYRGNPIE